VTRDRKIMSGGQTGADRAALGFALDHGIRHGGWCPKGRRAEDGPIARSHQDSLWSLDLFRTDSILLRTHWVLVVMDQFSRRIIGFGVQAVALDGVAL